MKKIMLIAIVLITSFSFAQNLKALDEKNGFRNLKFGMSIDSLKNSKIIESHKYQKYYIKTDENLKIGDFDVKAISYGFYKGHLDFILIEIVGYSNSRGIKGVFESQYGKGYQSNEYIEKYYWFGNNVSLCYDENSLNQNSKIMISTKMYNKEKEADKKAIEEKAKSEI